MALPYASPRAYVPYGALSFACSNAQIAHNIQDRCQRLFFPASRFLPLLIIV